MEVLKMLTAFIEDQATNHLDNFSLSAYNPNTNKF